MGATMVKCRGIEESKNFFVSKKFLKNNNGQLAIEVVLLMSVLISTFVFLTGQLRQRQVFQNLFTKPIVSLRNMTGYGTFKENCKGLGASGAAQKLSNCHPNSITRSLSSDPN